jgi:general secretion pathway protein D
LVEELLAPRGLLVLERSGVFFVGPASGRSEAGIPIGFGGRPEDVPDVPGKILQVVPLRYGVNVTIENTVAQYIEVEIKPDFQQGSFFLTGTRNAIIRALEIIRMFDQPSIRSSRLGLVNLTYISSKEFTDQLTVLLENEGIAAGVGSAPGKSVALVPLDQLGAVAVFASTSSLLDRIEFWAGQIDRPSQGTSERYFIYQPKYARAADLGESLGPLLGASVAPANAAGNLSRDTRSAIGDPSASRGGSGPAVSSFRGEGVTVSVDSRSNSLIFFTTGLRYESLLPMIRRLDIPPKQILLEATIAEVTLSGDFARGVEFAFTEIDRNTRDPESAGKELNGGTLGRIGLPAGGLALNYIPNLTDQVRLRLSASDGQVNVLSSPVLVVRDGVQATISVGNDVPTVGATASDPLISEKQITSILYRKTGLSLGIRPTINAQGLVVMEISQKISSTVPGSSGVQGAPVFFDREVSTEVVAGSGQSVLLAGLISESGSNTSSNVPGLGRIPGVGWLFRSDAKKKEKTELVLLITPRILETPEQWDAVRSNLARGLRYLDLSEFAKPAGIAGSAARPAGDADAPKQQPAVEPSS